MCGRLVSDSDVCACDLTVMTVYAAGRFEYREAFLTVR